MQASSKTLSADSIVFDTQAQSRVGPVIHALHRDAPPIDILVLIGAPSGGGKTTLSEALLAGRLGADFNLNGSVMRTDARSLRYKAFRGGSLIVEYATSSLLHRHDRVLAMDEIDHLIARSTHVYFLTLDVHRGALLRQYIGRLRSEDLRRTPGFLRYFRLRKWRQALAYLFRSDYHRGYEIWSEFDQFVGQYHHVRRFRALFDGHSEVQLRASE